jgi:hypothetical protein
VRWAHISTQTSLSSIPFLANVEREAQFYIEPAQEEDDEDNDEDDDDVDEDIGELVIHPEDVPVPVLPEATQIALRNKLCEGAYVGRNKKQEAALVGLRKMWAKT